MANYRAIATGLWSAGATWAGGAVPPNGEGHNIYSNSFTVTIDTAVNVALITNAAITASFVGGGTSAAAGGGFIANSNFNIVGSIGHNNTSSPATLQVTGAATFSITGNINGNSANGSVSLAPVVNSGSGTLTITGNINIGILNGTPGILNSGLGKVVVIGNVEGFNFSANSGTLLNTGGGTIELTGNIIVTRTQNGIYNSGGGVITFYGNATGSNSAAGAPISNVGAGFVNVFGNLTAGSSTAALINTSASATITVVGNMTASSTQPAIASSGGGGLRLSGSFISAINGRQAVFAPAFILNTTPLNARTRYALNGTGTYVDMFTADNSTALNQAVPTDVRAGVAYGIGLSQTGRLTVPARGSVALSVNYGPSMPFTATRSGTTATATLAYSYPLVVGDQITVTGASNSEWNSTYTIASVVSGTSVTFTVPNTHSATAGAGAVMQTTGTAVLDPAAVASAVWGAASRTITGGLVDTATTLTNTPNVPTTSQIASQVRTELSSELAKVSALNLTRLSQVTTTEILGNLLSQANS
jgi:hypothetical protein